MFNAQSDFDIDFGASLYKNADVEEVIELEGKWHVKHYGPDGELKDEFEFENMVVNEGLDLLLSATLAGGTASSTWYLGLIADATPTIDSGDTMASHPGWSENTNYDEAGRQTFQDGGVSGQSIDNSATPAQYSMNLDADTVSGAFLVDDNTKGGTAGSLYAAGTFGTNKNPDSGDTLEVTATFTTS